MAQTIKLKRSAQAGNTPALNQLELGEIAINTADGKMFIKRDDGTSNDPTIVEVGSTGSFLPLSGGTLTGNLSLGDNVKAQFGASNDLQIYHDGSNSIINDAGTGTIRIQTAGANQWEFNGLNFKGNDGRKIILGDSSDLQIYHDGSNSYIDEQGTGSLNIRSSTTLRLQNASGDNYLYGTNNGEVVLYHNNSPKLATTSTGIDVTGSVTADGLTVDGATLLDNGANATHLTLTGTTGRGLEISTATISYTDNTAVLNAKHSQGILSFKTASTERLRINNNGDISFYNDSANQGLFFDSSTSRLGLGTTAPSQALEIKRSGNNGNVALKIHNTGTATNDDALIGFLTEGNRNYSLGIHRDSGSFTLSNQDASVASGELLTIANSGNATFSGSVTANAGLAVDNITIDGNEIDLSSGDLTLDVAGKINLDHGSPEILLKDDGTHYASFISSNTDFVIQSILSDKDMLFKGQDGSSTITALTLDMSDAGSASFSNNVNIPNGGLMVGATTAPTSANSNGQTLVLSGSGNTGMSIVSGTSSNSSIMFADGYGGTAGYRGHIKYNHADDSLNFATAATANRLTIDSSGSVGIGVTPSAWADTSTALQIGSLALEDYTVSGANVSVFYNNAFRNTSGNIVYKETDFASTYSQYNGEHTFSVAPSGTAGATISLTQALKISSSANVNIPNGSLMVGATTAPVKFLDVGVSSNASAIDANIRLNTHYGSQNTARGGIQMFDGANVTGQIDTRYDGTKVDMHFGSLYNGGYNTTSRMVITGAGNVGIGSATSPSALLHIASASSLATGIGLQNSSRYYGIEVEGGGLRVKDVSAGLLERFRLNADGSFRWTPDGTNHDMTLTADGNLLVGKTSADNTTTGVRIAPSFISVTSGPSANTAIFNRTGPNDGEVIRFQKDNVTVGSIASVDANSIKIGKGNSNLRFYDFGASGVGIIPCTSTGANSLNAVDLGNASSTFKDLYLSGGVIGGGAIQSYAGTQGAAAFRPNNDLNTGIFFPAADTFAVTTGGSEAYRVDSFGNLLVGKNTSTGTSIGAELRPTGIVTATVSGNSAIFLNRKSSDGSIATFQKDNTAKGNISVSSFGMGFGGGTRTSDFFLKTDGTASFAGGVNLGVGRTPTQRLDVNGTVRVSDGTFGGYFGAGSGITNSGASTDFCLRSDAVLSFASGGPYERARIISSGEFLIGCTSAGDYGITLDGSPASNSTPSMELVRDFSGTATMIRFTNISGSPYVGSITSTTSATAYNTSSDERLKDNIKDADDSGSKVDAIQVRQFDWKADGEHQDYGMVAQELLEVAPDAVTKGDTPDDMMGVDYSKLVPMLIKEIQSLRQRVAQLEE